MAKSTCHKITDLAFPIELIQTGINLFSVIYGQQQKHRLTYDQAALEYGAAIMHALACDGLLDNRKEDR